MGFEEKQQEKVNLRVGDEQTVENQSQTASETAGPYVLGETLGSSQNGISRRAVDSRSDIGVVVRIFNTHSAHKATFDKRLKIELESAKSLSHPSIVSIIENGHMPNGAPYVVTEYIDDPTLFDVLHTTVNLNKTQLLGYLIGACQSFAHAHEIGVVHRKIDARQIFVLSTPIDGIHVRTTGYGTKWVGDSRNADPQIDVFAFGALIEEAFFGKSMPPEVENIVAFCKADPSNRYADCNEVLQNLLLVNVGKLPNPPKNRAGQKWMKPMVVAGVVIVTVVVTALAANHFLNVPTNNSTNNSAVQTITPTPIDLEIPASDAPVQRSTQAPVVPPSTSSSPRTSGLTRDEIKKSAAKTAAAAAVVGVASYQSMSAENKAKAKQVTVDSAKTTVKKWQSLDASSKDKWKNRAKGAASKVGKFWKKLPSSNN